MLKQLRAQPSVNAVLRNAIATIASNGQNAIDWLTSRWRVAGEVAIDVVGHRLVMNANADDQIVDSLFYRHDWETGELNAWKILVDGARTVLDVGANTGVYALLSAAIQPQAKVYAFEPHPTNYRRLVANINLNHVTNIEAIEQAVGDKPGRVEFTIPADEGLSLVSSAVRPFAEAHHGIEYKQVAVTQTTLDAFVTERRLETVDIVKIDVEYYELAVLRGAEKTFATHGPVVLCEVFDYEVFTNNDPKLMGRISATQHLEVHELLRKHGYHSYYVGKHGLLRVTDLHSRLDGGSNYVFSRVKTEERFLPFAKPDLIRSLMARPA
jgi:FkbM family methyltransferase